MTTSTTPVLDLPYPEGDEYVIGGDDAIEALAVALDVALNPLGAYAVLARQNSGAALGGTPVVVPFPGAASLIGFAYADGVLTYTGAKNRTFMFSAEVEVTNGTGGGTTSIESTVYLYGNGSTVLAGSHDNVQHTGPDLVRRDVTHRLSAPVELAPGDTLHVSGLCSPAGTLGVVGVRVYPIGAAA